MKTCDVKFVDGGYVNYVDGGYVNYTYYVPDHIDLKVGDYVIVLVGDVPKTAKVIYASSLTPQKATKHIAGKVDLTWYYSQVALVKKKADILKKLAKLEKDESEFTRFEKLAERNAEAAQLLRELKEI